MKKSWTIKQGEIWMAQLGDDAVGSEQKKTRPVLIVSADVRNESSPNVFIFPLTHSKKRHQPCHFILYKEAYPCLTYEENIVLCEEGRSISKSRLDRKIGEISDIDIANILQIKEYVFVEKV